MERRFGVWLVVAIGLVGSPGWAAADPRPGDHGGFSYAYVSDGGSITASGDMRDLARARSFKSSGPMLWFRDGAREFLVRDPDTLAQLDAAWRPSRALDAAAAELDRQHDELDRKQDELDARQDGLDSRQEALASRESALADREEDATPAGRAELAKQRRALQQEQRALAAELRTLDRPRKELRTQLDALEKKLDALRPQQTAASSKEGVAVRAILRAAIASGTARPIK
jgi:prefoldin subunit 5